MMMSLFLCPTILETRQCILIGLPVRRRSASERCLCKKRNEQYALKIRERRENENNLNDSYIAITSFDDILVLVCLCIAVD